MSTQRFKATIARAGGKAFLVLPFDPNEVWGGKQRHHITGVISGRAVRGPLGFDGSQYVLPLGAAWRRGSGLDEGVEVEVELRPEGPQADARAPDVVAAFATEPEAPAFFDALATFYRKGYLRWLDGARCPEARQAHIAEMLSLLKAGKKQR